MKAQRERKSVYRSFHPLALLTLGILLSCFLFYFSLSLSLFLSLSLSVCEREKKYMHMHSLTTTKVTIIYNAHSNSRHKYRVSILRFSPSSLPSLSLVILAIWGSIDLEEKKKVKCKIAYSDTVRFAAVLSEFLYVLYFNACILYVTWLLINYCLVRHTSVKHCLTVRVVAYNCSLRTRENSSIELTLAVNSAI